MLYTGGRALKYIKNSGDVESLKKEVIRLEEKIDNNADMIINNMNKLHNHEEQIQKNSLKIKENSFALEIMKEQKKSIKRLYLTLTIISIILLLSIIEKFI